MATFVLPACCCVYLQTKQGKEAQSTVAEEIADNLYLMMDRFKKKTGSYPILVMDNIWIQSCIPCDEIDSSYGRIEVPEDNRLKIPAHSPDFNQTAEQSVCAVKLDVIRQVGELAQSSDPTKCRITAVQLRKMAENTKVRFEKGLIFPDGVRKSVRRMRTVYELVGSDADVEVSVSEHKKLNGTAGHWAPPGWR